jgi:hypothetical protein
VNSFTRPTGFSWSGSMTSMITFPARFKMSKICRSLQRQLFQKVPWAINFDNDTRRSC